MTEISVSTNGGARYQSEKVRVAVVGVGNCASAFVQGVEYYKEAEGDQPIPGLMHVDLGGYHIRDIEFTAAFDIDKDKVGKDLSEAIWAGQNNTIKFADVPHLGVPVYRGMTHDGLGKYLKQKIEKAPGETDDIIQILKETKTDVVVSYLPVGSEQATKWYVEQVLEAGCGFVNCIPVFIASQNYWANRFRKAGLPIVGDDIKSQVGATIVHRTLASLFQDRGLKLAHTSQLNVGGNMDFFNMLERERLESKKISKTQAVTSLLNEQLPADDVHVGPSDYVPWLTDRKWAHIRLEAEAFGDVPLSLEAKLEVWDSPNSAGIVIDAVRCCKLALNHGIARSAGGAQLLPDEVASGAGARHHRTREHRELHRQVRRRAEAAGRRGPHQGRALGLTLRNTPESLDGRPLGRPSCFLITVVAVLLACGMRERRAAGPGIRGHRRSPLSRRWATAATRWTTTGSRSGTEDRAFSRWTAPPSSGPAPGRRCRGSTSTSPATP